jgi:hypothetical protein
VFGSLEGVFGPLEGVLHVGTLGGVVGDFLVSGTSSAAETWNLSMLTVVVEGVSSFVVSRTFKVGTGQDIFAVIVISIL